MLKLYFNDPADRRHIELTRTCRIERMSSEKASFMLLVLERINARSRGHWTREPRRCPRAASSQRSVRPRSKSVGTIASCVVSWMSHMTIGCVAASLLCFAFIRPVVFIILSWVCCIQGCESTGQVSILWTKAGSERWRGRPQHEQGNGGWWLFLVDTSRSSRKLGLWIQNKKRISQNKTQVFFKIEYFV